MLLKFEAEGEDALRAEMEGQWGGQPPAPERFVDLSLYNRARSHARP